MVKMLGKNNPHGIEHDCCLHCELLLAVGVAHLLRLLAIIKLVRLVDGHEVVVEGLRLPGGRVRHGPLDGLHRVRLAGLDGPGPGGGHGDGLAEELGGGGGPRLDGVAAVVLGEGAIDILPVVPLPEVHGLVVAFGLDAGLGANEEVRPVHLVVGLPGGEVGVPVGGGVLVLGKVGPHVDEGLPGLLVLRRRHGVLEVVPDVVEQVEEVVPVHMWTNFAKYEDPTPYRNPNFPAWEPYNKVDRASLLVGPKPSVETKSHNEAMYFWERHYWQDIDSTFTENYGRNSIESRAAAASKLLRQPVAMPAAGAGPIQAREAYPMQTVQRPVSYSPAGQPQAFNYNFMPVYQPHQFYNKQPQQMSNAHGQQ